MCAFVCVRGCAFVCVCVRVYACMYLFANTCVCQGESNWKYVVVLPPAAAAAAVVVSPAAAVAVVVPPVIEIVGVVTAHGLVSEHIVCFISEATNPFDTKSVTPEESSEALPAKIAVT